MEFTITGVSPQTRPWSSEQYGEFIAYRIKVAERGDEVIEWSRKTDSDPPTEGQKIDGEIVDNPKGDVKLKFKQSYSGGGNSSGGGSQKDLSPEAQARVTRCVAFEGAVRVFCATKGEGTTHTPESAVQAIGDLTDRLVEVLGVDTSEAPKQEAKPADPPADAPTEGQQTTAGNDDDIPF